MPGTGDVMSRRVRQRNRHSMRSGGLHGSETRPSRHHKLAPKKDAAEGSRRDYRRQGGGRNQEHPKDFGVRALQRASAKSQRSDRRSSVNRSSCGRRTSPAPRRVFMEDRFGITYYL